MKKRSEKSSYFRQARKSFYFVLVSVWGRPTKDQREAMNFLSSLAFGSVISSKYNKVCNIATSTSGIANCKGVSLKFF